MKRTLHFPFRKIVLLCMLLTWLPSISQTTVFNDDFTTSQGTYYTTAAGFIGTSTVWRNVRSGADFGSGIANSHLSLINDTGGTVNTNGWVLGYTNTTDFPAPYNATLASNPGVVTWTFTMRQSNSNPSGFAASEYGTAFILAGTAGTTNVTGTGYAVVLGNSGTVDPVRLIRYNSGIRNFTNLITSNTSGLTDFGVQYISVRVTYTPSTNTWQLFLRNDGTSATADPTIGTLASQGTFVNNSYTGTSLPLLGGYLNSGTVRHTAFFDRVRVTVGIPTLTSITPNTRVAGTQAFTLTINGNGFVPNSVARWNGQNRTTTYVSPTQLTVAIPATDIVSSGTASITVANGTTISNSLPLVIEPAGSPTLTPSVSFLNLATTITGTASASQTYTITGANLNNNPVVTAPANFEISTDGITYTSSLNLPRNGNTLAGGTVTIYARTAATAAPGNYSGSITHNSAGATEKLVALTAKVLAVEPSAQSTALTITNVTSSGFTVNWTNGNGARRIVLIRQGGAVTAVPVDGETYNANSIFGAGALLGSDNFAVYSGTGNSVNVSGLTDATAYHVAVFEYNGSNGGQNYKTGPLTGNRTTLNSPSGWQIFAANTVNAINFDTTVDGVNRNAFQGDGVLPIAQTGTLDSRAWAFSGFSDPAIPFGGTNFEDGDYDRGVSEGDVSESGLYAFETSSNNFSLGIQAASTEFSPGTATLRIQNQTGVPVTSVNLGYKVYVYNDQPNTATFGLSYSTDNSSYTSVAGVNVVSPTTADITPGWKAYYRVVTFPISIAPNNYGYIRWTTNVSGNGEADEFALDDIELIVNPSTNYVPFNGEAEHFALLGNATLSGDLTVNSGLVFNGGKLGLNGRTLTINGSVTNTVSGGLNAGGSGNIVMNGATNTSLSFDQTSQGTTNALNNLSINTSGFNTISVANSVVVNGALSVSTDQLLNLGTNVLTGTLSSINIDGTLLTQNTSISPLPSGKIWGGNGIVHYNAASANQTAVAGTYNNLTVSSSGGTVAGGVLTVNGILNLPTANPSSSLGSLSLGNYDLTMGGNATNTGIGDVTGTIFRNSIVANKLYTFGNPNTSIIFPNVGVLPTMLGLKITIGTAPTWRSGAINRVYDFIQSGGSGTKAIIKAFYLDSELNGNDESRLVDFAYIIANSTLLEQGRSNYNTTENWVELTNINVGLYFRNTFGQVELTLDEMATGFLTWNGSQSNSWTTALNWTPNATPSDDTKVIIPDAETTLNDPLLNPSVTVGAITIEPGGILNSPAGSQLTIKAGAGAWLNNGVFNPGTGTNRVTFTNLDASIAGETTFNNLTIASGAGLRPLTGNNMKIAGEFLRLGNFSAGAVDNTVEYSGTNQAIATLTGALAAYNNLTISGTGAVFPTTLNITGDFTLNNSVNFSGKSITMNGSRLQTIGGTNSPVFSDLTINNTNGGVTLATDVSVNGTLTLTLGVLSLNSNNLTLGTNPVSGTFDVTRMIVTDGTGQVRRTFAGLGSYFFPIGEKISNPSYSPINVAVTSGTFSNAYVGVGVVDSVHPNNGSTQNYISRYWKVTQSGISDAVATVTANYVAAEVLVPESTMVAAQLIGTFNRTTNPWIKFAPLANNTITATGASLPSGQTSVFTGLKAGDFTVEITGYGAFCLNQQATLSASITGGDAPYTYTWSGGLGNASTATPPTAAVGSTDYALTVRDANGLLATDTATVFVLQPSLGGTLTGIQYVCMNSKPNDIQLTGQTGRVLYWQRSATSNFASPINISNTTNILTGDAIGPLQATAYFRAVISNGTCEEVYSDSTSAVIKTTTWNGTAWSAGLPDAATNAIIAGPYIANADFIACSVTVNNNASVTIASGYSATLEGALIVSSGSFTLEDSASLVQTDDEAVNIGSNFTMKRNAKPMYRYDYTYWSSPVEAFTLYALSPTTEANKYFGWNASTNAWVPYLNGNQTMVSGTGYIVRAPQSYSTNPEIRNIFTGEFKGRPHNGVVSIPVIGGEASNLLGNPYPSAISADAFLTNPANASALDGTLYFWTHNSAPVNSEGGNTYNYTTDDYAIYNLVGGVGTGSAAPSETLPNTDNTPTGMIASGQAFFVTGNSFGIATFDNSMRTAEDNSQFFRSNTNVVANSSFEKHRIWCSVRGTNRSFKQILVAYAAGATEEYDRGLDGEFYSESNGLSLYSLGASKKLSIQSLGLPFDQNNIVLLGFKASEAGSYTFVLDKFDGLFQNQEIFLHDKLMNIYHNAKNSAYSFVSAEGTFDDRFEIVYRDASVLGIGDSTFGNNIVVFKQAENVKIVSSRSEIRSVEVSDIQGRIIYKRKDLSGNSFVLDGLQSQRQVLIVNITTDDDKKVSKKIIF